MRGDNLGNVIVQQSREIMAMLRLRPVAEHDRHRGQHLQIDAMPVAIFESPPRLPTVVLDLAKGFAVDHQAGASGAGMLQVHEAAVTVPLPQVRPRGRQDVSVKIDLANGPALREGRMWKSGCRMNIASHD